MPRVSLFFGIIIGMYFDDHNPPHIHATYQDYEAAYDFDGNRIGGEMARKQEKLIAAWIEIHKEDLLANWQLAKNGGDPLEIEPLR